jgi:hypothetical protein
MDISRQVISEPAAGGGAPRSYEILQKKQDGAVKVPLQP